MRPDVNPRDYLVAESPAMRAAVAHIERIADSDGPALVCGEHGTGRELVARLLHQLSPRRSGRFVAVRPTFEAPGGDGDDGERARRALRAAQGGTLLVKDVCDVAASGQKALRRAMRTPERERRPDSSGEVFDVRVVGSADLDLERAVAAKMLSPELYESMASRRIDVPPLRDRGDDVLRLAHHFLERQAQAAGRPTPTLDDDARDALCGYRWPGNVRELQNCLERAAILAEGDVIRARHLRLLDPPAALPPVPTVVARPALDLDGTLAEVVTRAQSAAERAKIAAVLAETEADVPRAARILDVPFRELLAKMRAHGLGAE